MFRSYKLALQNSFLERKRSAALVRGLIQGSYAQTILSASCADRPLIPFPGKVLFL